jgi:DNA-3-methyladenine glycosylase
VTTRLAADFYAQDTIEVARRLLGKILLHRLPDGVELAGRIVETEAYLGVEDPAAHSFGGRRTARTEVMFGDPGRSYIYFIYGMHFCFNVVTMPRETPQAVLVRALEPVRGVERMRAEKPHAPLHHLANGPAKLCAALHLTKAQNALDLTTSAELWIAHDGLEVREKDIVDGPRIGVDYAADAALWPLRFGVRGHPALSPAKFPNYMK